jgi:hypothetical protein
VYIDESKAKGYVVVAVSVPPVEVPATRRLVRGLVAPGQRRVHMKSEKAPRKREILTAVAALELGVVVYAAETSRYRTDIAARRACLDRLVADHAHLAAQLVLESDPSQDPRDRRDLIELTRSHGCPELAYTHTTAAAEPLLALPDVIAWAWARGDDWRRRIAPAIERVTRV